MPYYCSCCLTEVFPFQSLIDSEFCEIFSNGNFIMKSCKFNNMTFSTKSQCCLPKNFNLLNPKKNSLILLHVNTCSLRKNIDKLEKLLIDIKVMPDLIAISETKLKTGVPITFTLSGYDFVHVDSSTHAGGVGMFIRSVYYFNTISTFNLNTTGCEDLWIEFLLPKNKKCIVGTVYRHPTSDARLFSNKFATIIDKLNRTNNYFYICGDFNIDLMDSKRDVIKHYQDTLL